MWNIFKSDNRIIKNVSWMFISRIINIISGVLVSIVVTRYLGAQQKGIMANVTAIASFFSFFTSFGLSDILIKEYARDKESSKETAVSAACMMFVGGGLSFILAVTLAKVLGVDDYSFKLVIIYAVMYFFDFFKVFEYWFYSQAETKIYTIGQFIVHIVALILRVIGTIVNADLIWFILCTVIESILTSLILWVCYKFVRVKMQGNWRCSRNIVLKLLKPCLPILVTGFATSIYMKVDQIMVGKMLTSSDLGVYSVAVNLAEYWYFIPGVIYMSFLPVLTESLGDNKRFKELLQKFSDIMVGIGYLAVVGVLLVGRFFIVLLYGTDFEQSSYILMIYIWSGIFTCLSYAGQAYFIINNNTKILMYIQIIGALLNVFLNLIFIPIMGVYGAAFATLMEYAIVAFGQMILLHNKYKDLYDIELRALIPFKRLIRIIKK